MRVQKSRKHRRVRVTTPGGISKLVYKRKKPGKAQCSMCGDYLKGMPRERVRKMKKTPRTRKRPERPYGGVLCTKCARELLAEKARSMYKEEKEEQT